MKTLLSLSTLVLALAAPAAAWAAAPTTATPAATPISTPEPPAGAVAPAATTPRRSPDNPADELPTGPPAAPAVEVAFVLDTTGSMSGLLEGAKRKIWWIASRLAEGTPRPDIRFALVGYRDRGDAYVTTVSDLTKDLDAIYETLQGFQAQGGGDMPESVNEALRKGVRDLSWSKGPGVARILFLVGDAPPHMDYDEVKYPALVEEARAKGIVVNAIQCGGIGQTTPIWQAIAKAGQGEFAAIAQDGGMVAIATPFDGAIAKANAEVGTLLLPYGSATTKRAVMRKQALSEAASGEARAERLKYNMANGQIVSGGGDLCDDWSAGRVTLSEIEADALPDALRGLEGEALVEALKATKAKREALRATLKALSAKRDEWLHAERKRRAGEPDGFDVEVMAALEAQVDGVGLEL